MKNTRKDALLKGQGTKKAGKETLESSFQKLSGQYNRVPVSTNIDKDIYREFKMLALSQNLSIRDLLEKIMRDAVASQR